MNTLPLTKRQTEILRLIRTLIEQNGYSPNYRELQAALGQASPNGVYEHIKNLERKGYLKTVPGRANSIQLVEPH